MVSLPALVCTQSAFAVGLSSGATAPLWTPVPGAGRAIAETAFQPFTRAAVRL